MPDEAIAVFTARSPQRIVREGGSQAWALDPTRARKCRYLICVQNQHNSDRDFSDASEAHGAVFMVGKISDVVPASANDAPGRWRICISEYSIHHVVHAWKGWRNPVRYTTLEEMGIILNDLKFHSVAQAQQEFGSEQTQSHASDVTQKPQDTDEPVIPLSIASAKSALAAHYGVSPSSIEIVIRG